MYKLMENKHLKLCKIWHQHKKGTKNVVANHLSRLESEEGKNGANETIKDMFSYESLFTLDYIDTRWFANIANFIYSSKLPPKLSNQQRKKLIYDSKGYIWDNPFL